MALHINKDRDNLKDEVIEINEQYSTDFGVYYHDFYLQQKIYIDQKHVDALIDMLSWV